MRFLKKMSLLFISTFPVFQKCFKLSNIAIWSKKPMFKFYFPVYNFKSHLWYLFLGTFGLIYFKLHLNNFNWKTPFGKWFLFPFAKGLNVFVNISMIWGGLPNKCLILKYIKRHKMSPFYTTPFSVFCTWKHPLYSFFCLTIIKIYCMVFIMIFVSFCIF